MLKLICSVCGENYSADERIWRCGCGGVLGLAGTPPFRTGEVSSYRKGIWKYASMIPVSPENIVTLGEGNTPLLPFQTVFGDVLIKQDHLFPSGSYKDRGAAVLISRAREIGVEKVVEDSSGNAGASVAAYCAAAGIECEIYVPESTSIEKLSQIKAYGAQLHRIAGPRENSALAAIKKAEHLFYASHSWNPWFFHGTKTFAYELFDQLGGRAPDTLVLPAGNGTLLLGAWLGFTEIKKAGLIERLPAIIAVQASACAPLYKAFEEGWAVPAEVSAGKTAAEGIAIGSPARGFEILKAVRDSGGSVITVTEMEIKKALTLLVGKGFFVEPTSAAVIAGVLRYQEMSRPDEETIVTAFTGHGLKNAGKIMDLL